MDEKDIFSTTMVSAYGGLKLLNDEFTPASALRDKFREGGIRSHKEVVTFLTKSNLIIPLAHRFDDARKIVYVKNHFVDDICDLYDRIISKFGILSEISSPMHKDPMKYIYDMVESTEKRNKIDMGIVCIVFNDQHFSIYTKSELNEDGQRCMKDIIGECFKNVMEKKEVNLSYDLMNERRIDRHNNIIRYKTIMIYSLSNS